eukprot:2761904-Karenia_brevis.AAC.1
MDRLLHEAWMPIFRMYHNRPEPSWQDFESRYDNYIHRYPMVVSDITGKDLRRILQKMRVSAAPGMDGWTVPELRLLPLCLLNCLADLLNIIEETGRWPIGLDRALVSLIGKGEGAKPLDLRPISLMSIIYRTWAVRRLEDIRPWQEKWAADGQHGFRPGHSTQDVYWSLALKIETAILNGAPLFGIGFDYRKCFDCIPHDILLKLVGRMGLSPRILTPVSAMYGSLRRFFRVGGGIGMKFMCTNGILQGCPVSVVLLNALVAVWANALPAEVRGAQTTAYADDTYALTTSRRAITETATLTDEYAQLTGQSIHAAKSHAFTTVAGGRKSVKMNAGPVHWVKHTVALGADLTFQGQPQTTRLEINFGTAKDMAGKIAWLPLGFE